MYLPDPNISQGFAWFLQSTLWKGQDRRSASCFAISVLPCPGGPEKRSTRGFSDSSVFIVWLATSPRICSSANDWPNIEEDGDKLDGTGGMACERVSEFRNSENTNDMFIFLIP